MPDCQFRINFAPNERHCFGNIFDFRTERKVKVYGWNSREIVRINFEGNTQIFEGCCLKVEQEKTSECKRGEAGTLEVEYTWPDAYGDYIDEFSFYGVKPGTAKMVVEEVFSHITGDFLHYQPRLYICDCYGYCGTVGDSLKRLRWYRSPNPPPIRGEWIVKSPGILRQVCTTLITQQLQTGEVETVFERIDTLDSDETGQLCPTYQLDTVESPVEDHVREITIGSWEYILVTKNLLDSRGNVTGYSPYNAINIYIGSLLAIPNESAFINYETFIFGVYHVAQFRNLPNCPHPRVEVVCEPIEKKEKCPPNTCEVDCGDRICCYDNQGNPVKSIKK